MTDSPLIFNTPYLNHYLQMVEDTESPRIFHIWSAVFGIAASLGRRVWLPFGTFDIFPNHYILLVGTPGTRKSTAMNQAKKALRSSTGVRFAPADTGGQRQGLVLAMLGGEADKEFLGAAELGGRDNTIMTLTQLDQVTNDPDENEQTRFIDEADKHHIAVVASEFSRFIGQNNLAMLDFLGERYDGEPYTYKTRQSEIVLEKNLLNLLACTTPVSMANSLPPGAGGQGFLSRMVLVYGARKYRMIARPRAPDVELVMRVKDTLNNVYHKTRGIVTETDGARSYSESLYGYALDIADSRFGYYNERRYTHLIKLAMCLCAARSNGETDSLCIVQDDYEEAHRILRATERGMPDALGEFGMNPLAMLKQEILEQLRATQGPLTLEQVVAMFHRDARSHEITEVVNDLIRMGQVRMSTMSSGIRVMSAVFTKQNTEDAMMNLLAEK